MPIKYNVEDFSGKVVGSVDLSEKIFQSVIRRDILARVVFYQLAKRRSGSHQTKGISSVSGTTRKPFNQKGTGRARQGSLRSPQFRGGAVIFGPLQRSHAVSLQKKVRQLGLCCALSAKMKEGKIRIFQDLRMESGKTRDALKWIKDRSVLMVDGSSVCQGLARAISIVPHLDILPCQGLNVYDILNHDFLYLSREAVEGIHQRLGVNLEEVHQNSEMSSL